MMLYNRYPFSDNGRLERFSVNISRLISGNVIFQEGLRSKDAEDLILKLLAPCPKDRISASDALNHKWFIDNDLIVQCHEVCSNVLQQLDEVDQQENEVI